MYLDGEPLARNGHKTAIYVLQIWCTTLVFSIFRITLGFQKYHGEIRGIWRWKCYLLLYNLVFNSRMLPVCSKPRTYNFFQSYFAVLEIGNYFLGYYVDGLHGGPLVLSVLVESADFFSKISKLFWRYIHKNLHQSGHFDTLPSSLNLICKWLWRWAFFLLSNVMPDRVKSKPFQSALLFLDSSVQKNHVCAKLNGTVQKIKSATRL